MALENDENDLKRLSMEEDQETDDVPELTKSNCASVDVDEVWHYLGMYGRYQTTNILLLFLSLIPQSYAILCGVFVGMPVKPKCHSEAVDTLDLTRFSNGSEVMEGECHFEVVVNSTRGVHVVHKTPCYRFEYGTSEPTSFLAEWDLVCDSNTLGQLPQMLTMLGMMVGAMTLPPVGDRFGRKLLSVGSQICHVLTMMGLAYAPAFEIFLLLKFLSGAFNQGFMVTEYIMLMELLPKELRTLMAVLATVVWVLSVLSLVPVAIIFKGMDWRSLQLTYGVISLVCVSLFFNDESLRWLLVNRKAKRAEKVLKKACRLNRKSYQGLLQRVLREKVVIPNGDNNHDNKMIPSSPAHSEKTVKTVRTNPSLKDILASPTMRRISFIVIYSWMVNSLTYYGITLLSTSLAGDPYMNFLIGAIMEVPSIVFMFLFLARFGRKYVTIAFTGGAGVSLLAAVLVATLAAKTYALSLVQTGLTLFGKFCIAASFNVMWLYTPELYPTNLRNVGVGMSSMGARIAASASPFFTILAQEAIWAPGALCAGACFLCVFLLTFLPETKFRELPSTIAEVEGWYSHREQSRSRTNVVDGDEQQIKVTFVKIKQDDEDEDDRPSKIV